MRLTVVFEALAGDWGAQIGWATVDASGAIPGLRLHRLPVFRVGVDDVAFGMPLLQGELPGSRYSGITFDTDRHRTRFLQALAAALRADNPELFAQEQERQS